MTSWKKAPWKTKQAMCVNKARFSEHTAKKVARQHGQRAYFCPICSTWHCTSRRP